MNGSDKLFGWIPFVFLLSILLLITVLVTIWLKHHKEKKTWKNPTLVLSGILLLMVIEIPLKIIYKNCNTVSRDPELLGMLKNDDETSEFILNRDYYAFRVRFRVSLTTAGTGSIRTAAWSIFMKCLTNILRYSFFRSPLRTGNSYSSWNMAVKADMNREKGW